MLHIKLDQDWPPGFRDIKVQKCEIFVTQGQVTPKWMGWFGQNSTKLLCLSWLPATLMMIRLKNEWAMSSLPARIKRIGSKATEKRWRHHFPHYKSMGAFCYHGHHSFDPICLQTLCSLSSPPVKLHIKFDQDWSTGLRDIQVRKCNIFVIQGLVTPKCVVWSGPKSNSSELLCLSWLPATLMMIR